MSADAPCKKCAKMSYEERVWFYEQGKKELVGKGLKPDEFEQEVGKLAEKHNI